MLSDSVDEGAVNFREILVKFVADLCKISRSNFLGVAHFTPTKAKIPDVNVIGANAGAEPPREIGGRYLEELSQ